MTPNECLTGVSSRILNFDEVGGMRSLLMLGTTNSKNFWFLNFTFPFPVIEFTWYIRFWRFCGFPCIAMRGLLLFSQRTLQLKQGNSLIKKKSQKKPQPVKQCRMHPPAMPPNFKKNGSLLHKIHLKFQCRVTQKLVLWRLAPFVASGHKYKNKKIIKTTVLWTSRSARGTKENCYFGLQVSVPNPNSLCATYASTCP